MAGTLDMKNQPTPIPPWKNSFVGVGYEMEETEVLPSQESLRNVNLHLSLKGYITTPVVLP